MSGVDRPTHRVQLLPQGLRIDGQPELRSRLLPRLIAALLQAHEQGLARVDSPCSRAELREQGLSTRARPCSCACCRV